MTAQVIGPSFGSIGDMETSAEPIIERPITDLGLEPETSTSEEQSSELYDTPDQIDVEKLESRRAEATYESPKNEVSSPTISQPDNAMEWGLWKKIYHTSIPAMMGLAV